MGRTRLAVTKGFATSGLLNPQYWFAGGGFGWNKIPVFHRPRPFFFNFYVSFRIFRLE